MFILEVLYYENFNLEDIVTPVDAEQLNKLLIETNFNEAKRKKTYQWV